MTINSFLRAIALIPLCICGLALASQPPPRLHIDFPPQWEYREPVRRDSVLYLHARQQLEGTAAQRLNVSVIDTRAATKPVDSRSILGLVEKLRDVALQTSVESSIDVVPMDASQGYYFVATDRDYQPASGDDDYRQLVEGVLLRSGYLINFTLLTNDADSVDTIEMISALAELRID